MAVSDIPEQEASMTQTLVHDTPQSRIDLYELGEVLQSVLVDLVDLSLLGKHVHWNVEGVGFRSLHLELDELVDAWRRLGDAVAERAVMLGLAIDGQAATIARDSRIDALPGYRINDRDAIDGLSDRLTKVIERTRHAMGEAAVRDTVTEDLLVSVVMALEKQHWMLRVQRSEPAS